MVWHGVAVVRHWMRDLRGGCLIPSHCSVIHTRASVHQAVLIGTGQCQ